MSLRCYLQAGDRRDSPSGDFATNGERSRTRLLAGMDAHVNLIPLNPTPGHAVRGTPPARVRAFADLLGDLGTNATIRRTA